MLLGHFAHDPRRFLQRCISGSLELEEQAVFLWPFALGHAIEVGGPHKPVIHQFHAFYQMQYTERFQFWATCRWVKEKRTNAHSLIHDLNHGFRSFLDIGEVAYCNICR